MNVTLHSFSKKHNSTAVPAPGTGTSVTVVLKDQSGVLDPVIELQTQADPSAFNYLHIPEFGRYYWLREWTYYRGAWTGSFYVDPMASWKAGIGAQTLYVYRSSAAWDGKIVDNYYPMNTKVSYAKQDIPSPFSINVQDPTADEGFYVVGIIVGSDITYIAVTAGDLEKLISGLFSNQYFESVSGATQLTPEIKTRIDPMQYISKIHYIPCKLQQGFANTWGYIGYLSQQTVSTLKIGKGTIDFQQLPVPTNFRYYEFIVRFVTDMYYPINIRPEGGGLSHPQISSRGAFLRSYPYTKWTLWMPPYGLIELPSDAMVDATELLLRMTVDVRTGDSRFLITATNLYGDSDTVLVNTTGSVAIDHPLANIFTPGTNYMSLLGAGISGVLSAATGNYAGIFGAIQNGINTYAAGTVPHLSTMGSQGSGSQFTGTPQLVAQFIEVVDDDLQGRGRPLCAKRQISSIPGYITADPDELTLPATARELEEIRGFISGGFFYE